MGRGKRTYFAVVAIVVDNHKSGPKIDHRLHMNMLGGANGLLHVSVYPNLQRVGE